MPKHHFPKLHFTLVVTFLLLIFSAISFFGPGAVSAGTCEPNPAMDLTGSLTGGATSATGTITNSSADCSYDVGLATFEVYSNSFEDAGFFAGQTAVIGPGETISLTVNTPTCRSKSILFFGELSTSVGDYAGRNITRFLIMGRDFCERPSGTPTPTPPVPTATQPPPTSTPPPPTPTPSNTPVPTVTPTPTPTTPGNTLLTLGDRVWYDQDQDGIQDPNEPGYNGVTVNLHNNAQCRRLPNATTTTAVGPSGFGNGFYQFANLQPGLYCLSFSGIPAGWSISPANQGGNDATDSDVNSSSQILNINLTANDPNQDMGIYVPGTLGDTVVCVATGLGIADITVSLFKDFDGNGVADGGAIATTATDATGFYEFTGLEVALAGDPNNTTAYIVTVDVNDPDLGTCNTAVSPTEYNPELDSDNPDDPNNDFAFDEAPRLTLGDRVWYDQNQDGIQDPNEPGYNGITVDLYDNATCSGTPTATTTTAAGPSGFGDGFYEFTNLLPGSYCVEFSGIPSGWDISPAGQGGDNTADSDADGNGQITNINLTADNPDEDMGIYVPGSLGDTVICLATGDGLANITVTLFADFDGNGVADGPAIDTTTTDANGFYQFTGLEVALAGDPNNTTAYIVTVDVNDADLGTCNVLVGPDDYNPELDSDNPDDPNNDFAFTEIDPAIDIDKMVMVPGTNPPQYTDDIVQVTVGSQVTYAYFVTNPGDVALSDVEVVDDNATANDTSDDVTFTINSPEFVGGDNGNGLLDPGEVWQFVFTKTAAFISDNPGNSIVPVATSEMGSYLLIGTTSNSIAKAVNVQNGDLGADVIVLSTEINDNVDFDNDDVFLHNAGSVWVDYDNLPNTQPDYLPGAAPVGEGVTWTGDVALTSPNAKFDLSNVELYGQVGVVADSSSPVSSVSNSLFFPDGVGNGVNPSGGQNLPPNGLTANADAAMAALRAELDAFEQFVTELTPEVTLSPSNGLPTSNGIEDVDIFVLTINPSHDINNDGIVVYDINMGSNDFKITNSNWIIDGDGSKFAIFRIRGNSNLVLNQSTIVLGDGGIAENGLGAIFVKAAEFRNASGGYNSGETNSGDTVFSFNDTVLNGVGFYDLIVFDESIGNSNFDNGTTELKINNGQGCSHFISPKINFNNVRFDRCAFGSLELQTNIAGVVGLSAIGAVMADDSATIEVVSPQ